MKRLSILLGWLTLVIATTALTWQIVSAAEAEVVDRPASPLNVAAPEFDRSSTTTITTSTTSSSTATTEPSTTTTTLAAPATSSTPTTTTPSVTSTSTETPTTSIESPWSVTTRQTPGGTVVIRHRPEEVFLQAATPAPGFQVEVDSSGPDDVEVEFESEEVKVEFHAEWIDGRLEIEVDVDEKEDEDED